jgi:hypothetical protein
MKQLLILAISCFLLLSINQCTSDKKVNTEAVKNEIKSREIKKVTEAEIVSRVMELGKAAALGSKQTLGKNLQQALQDGGVEYAIDFCNLNAMPIVDSLSKNFDATIKRVSLKVRNLDDYPSDLEKQILEAYEYQWKDSIPLQANVQAIGEDQYLFTQPIMVENALCLTCHGKPENGFLKETGDFIKSKYPNDQATGYEIGDLRGMWSITFPKKKIIQSL